jgi:hypothetical protein
MKKINFDTEKPIFDNGHCKWYLDKHFQMYLTNQQAENLPRLEDLRCFIVKGPDIEDYVLIDDKQNILASFKYTQEGFGQMEARINIMKISKNYNDHEVNV